MRWLPCPRCKQGASGGRELEPLLVSYISPRGYTYKCSACRMTNRITASQFLALPKISPAELADPRGRFNRWPQFSEMVLAHYTSRPGPSHKP